MIDELVLRGGQAALVAAQWAPRLMALRAGLADTAASATTTAAAATTTVSSGSASTALTTAPLTTIAPSSAAVTTAPVTTTPPATTTTTSDFPTVLLSCLIWASLAFAVVILLLPERTREQRDRIRTMAVVGVSFPLLLAVLGLNYQITQDTLGGTTAYEERRNWISGFPVHLDYHLAVDGVSLPLLLVTTVLFAVAVVASWRQDRRVKLYFVLLLVLETGVNGALCAFDYGLLVAFLGVEALPTFLLIAVWGGERRMAAAWRQLTVALISVGLLLLCTVLIGVKAQQGNLEFLQISGAGGAGVYLHGLVAGACFWISLIAFGVRLPIPPLHGWFTAAVAEASAPVGAIVGGVSTVLGGYGLLRVTLSGFPDEAHHFSLALAVIAVAASLWGTVGALGQEDLRRLVAYTAIGQGGLVLLAVSAQSSIALNGVVLLLVAHALALALLVLITGAVEERTRTRSIARLGGLAWQMPRLTALWVVGGLTAMGVPFLAGFGGLVQLYIGAYPQHRFATMAVMATTAITTGYLVWTVQRVFFGPARDTFARLRDAGTLELLYLVPVAVLILGLGVAPGRVLPVINNGVQLITTRLTASGGG